MARRLAETGSDRDVRTEAERRLAFPAPRRGAPAGDAPAAPGDDADGNERPVLVLRRPLAAEEAWEALPEVTADPRRLRAARVVTADKLDPAHMAYDMLRTRLWRQLRERRWRTVALTSPAPSCGKTLSCLNLAWSFARQPSARVLALDLDLRRPRLGATLGIKPDVCVSRLLAGEAYPEEVFLRLHPRLAFAFAAGPQPGSSELLGDERAAIALAESIRTFAPDVVLIDLPPLLASDDAAAFLPVVDGALLVAAAGETPLEDIEVCARHLGSLTEDLGVILNKSAFMPRRYYGYGYGY